ncbi:MAG: ROK family protein [Gemmatimonadota bacterium]|nr:ROK family protein [Gemmatimonadota bacterium]
MKRNESKIIPAYPRTVRQINRASVLSLVLDREPISRVKISELTGLKQCTVSNIVNQLIEENLICEASRQESSLGRKPINLKLNEKYRIYGVIDLTLWKTCIGVCDLGGHLLDEKFIPTIAGDAEGFLTRCVKILARMLNSASGTLAGVCVIVPSRVNSSEGYILRDDELGWKDVNVKRIIGQYLDCKLFVEKDSRAGALAEISFGEEARDISNFVFVLVDKGIGTGIVISNQIYYGAHFLDGQFGLEGTIKINGKWERVSKENAWEKSASDIGIINRYCSLSGAAQEKDGRNQVFRINRLAMNGDPHAVTALKETTRQLGVGIAEINNFFDPERIIIGGKITQVWDLIFPELVDQVERLTPYQAVPVQELIVPSSFSWATFEGARALILQDLFGGYRIVHRPSYWTVWESKQD